MAPTAQRLFGRAAYYLDLIDEITSVAVNYEYHFMSDETFARWQKSNDFSSREFLARREDFWKVQATSLMHS